MEPSLVIQKIERIRCETDFPLASDSPDHLHPLGTRFDRSSNSRFVRKLLQIARLNKIPQLRVLDLGCSAGTSVRQLIDYGQFAIGLEGSDYSRMYSRDAWGVIPKFLFTADITKPFRLILESDGTPTDLDFHVITAWEVLEHLTEDQVSGMLRNVSSSLGNCGLLIVSVDTTASPSLDDIELHQCIQTEASWNKVMIDHGFQRHPEAEAFFDGQYVRGPKKDHVPSSFNMVLSRIGDKQLEIPTRNLKERFYDVWHFSRPQLWLRNLISPSGVD